MKINAYTNTNNRDYTAYMNKIVQNASTTDQQTNAGTALSNMGLTQSDSMKKAYGIYKQAGSEPTLSQMQATEKFLNTAEGSETSKLTSIAVASQKGIDITADNLNAVHSALNDSANESMTIEGLSPETVKEIKSALSTKEKLDNLPPAVKDRIIGVLNQLGIKGEDAEKALAQLVSGGSQAMSDLKSILPEGVTKQLKQLIQIADLKQQIADASNLKPSLNDLAKDLVQEIGALPDLKTVKAWLEQLSSQSSEKLLQLIMKKMSDSSQETGFGEVGMIGASATDAVKALIEALKALDAEGTQTAEGTDVKTINEASQTAEGTETSASQTPASTQESLKSDLAYFDGLSDMLDQVLELMQSGYGSEQTLNTLDQSQLKQLVVTEVTVEMIKAKQTFDTFKQESLKQLNEATVKANPQVLSDAVTKVALKLDHLIMNTDVTLYTDMKSERALMGLSADLQEIAQMAKQNPDKALAQLKLVQSKLEAFNFNPSKVRVEARLSEKAQEEGLANKALDTLPKLSAQGGAKGVLDLMRQLGLNREPELMEQIMSAVSSSDKTAEKKDSFKELLLQLSTQDQKEDEQLIKAVEKGLSQLTGQQLLNRPDTQQDTQSLFFNLPLAMGDQEAKLYVKARKTANRMDWENCSLYVLVDLKQYGETGIRINVSSKQLSVTVSNADKGIMDVMKPLAENILAELREVGYLPGEIKYTPFVKTDAQQLLSPDSLEAVKTAEVQTNAGSTQRKGGFEWQV